MPSVKLSSGFLCNSIEYVHYYIAEKGMGLNPMKLSYR